MKADQEKIEKIEKNNSEVYEKPMIEIIEMEMEGNILRGSGDRYNPGGGWNS